jgi:hypothetical protein
VASTAGANAAAAAAGTAAADAADALKVLTHFGSTSTICEYSNSVIIPTSTWGYF